MTLLYYTADFYLFQTKVLTPMDCGIISNGLTELQKFSKSFEENLCRESPDEEFSCLCEAEKSSESHVVASDATADEFPTGCCSR